MSKIKCALDVVNDLRSLAGSIEGLVEVLKANETEVAPPKSKTKAKKSPEPKEEVAPEEKQPPTLEEVRAVMAAKNREGHREAVKAIILKYGANKLTALDSAHYAEVLKEVGEIK